MKKHNVGIQAAIAVLLGTASISSFAGLAQGLTLNIAAQAIIDNTTAFNSGSVGYSTQVPVPSGTFFARVQLVGGAKFVAAPVAANLAITNTGGAAPTVGAVVLSADNTYATFPITVPAGSTLQVATTLTFTSAAGNLNTGAYLNTVGASVGAAISIGTAIGGPTTPPIDIDGVAQGALVTSVPGVVATVLQSGAANFAATVANGGMAGGGVEARRIDVANGNGTSTTQATIGNTATNDLVNFGGLRLADNPAARDITGAAFTVAANMGTTYGGVVTGNFAAAQGAGGRVFISTVANCTADAGGTPNAVVTATTATFAGVTTPLVTVPHYVCMKLNNNNTVVIPSTTPSAVFTVSGRAAAPLSVAFSTTATPLYALDVNGGLLLVKSYIPAAQTGYTSFIRVINTGALPATISASVVNQSTGVAGTSAPLAVNLAAGGSVTLNSTQVEAALGAIANAADRPTLRLTAPTKFKAQSFILTNANGNFAVVSAEE